MSNWNKNDNHKHKAWMVLLSVLTPVLLVGVGFSAYFIRNEAETSAHINVDAEDFAEGNQSISISFTGDVTYLSSAYVNSDHSTLSDKAAITAEVTFKGFDNTKSASFLFSLSEPNTASVISHIGIVSLSDTTSGVTGTISDYASTTHELNKTITFTASTLPSPFVTTISYALPDNASNLSDATLTLKVAKQ